MSYKPNATQDYGRLCGDQLDQKFCNADQVSVCTCWVWKHILSILPVKDFKYMYAFNWVRLSEDFG